MKKTIKVKAVPGALVPDYEAQMQGVRRFLGWKFNTSIGERFFDENTKQWRTQGGWELTNRIVEVPVRTEYLQEIAAGKLELADLEEALQTFTKYGKH